MKARLDSPVIPDGTIKLDLRALLFGGAGDEVPVVPFLVWFVLIPAALPDQGLGAGKAAGGRFGLYDPEFPLDEPSVPAFDFGAKGGAF